MPSSQKTFKILVFVCLFVFYLYKRKEEGLFGKSKRVYLEEWFLVVMVTCNVFLLMVLSVDLWCDYFFHA